LFEYAGYEISDVQLFFKNVNQPLNVPVVGVRLNGVPLQCPPTSCDDSEQALDIEMAISMAPGLSQVVVYVGSSDVSIFSKMAADNTAKQLSCSWGWTDDESSLDPIFKEFAAQGQTVFVATGDNGSGTPGNSVWPADDPYVTAVGGTDLTTNGPGGAWESETGWSGSAGGPSKNKIPIPAYQKLPGVIDASNAGSTTLRNIPDVAAEANTNQYSCYDGSCSGGNGGTSYAAPQWAGFMAMVNQQAVANGAATFGFLNPTIYELGVRANYAQDFHDIVSGSNGKYSAVAGYDLVTGWGSFDGPTLLEALVAVK
jgi:kumamolisin